LWIRNQICLTNQNLVSSNSSSVIGKRRSPSYNYIVHINLGSRCARSVGDGCTQNWLSSWCCAVTNDVSRLYPELVSLARLEAGHQESPWRDASRGYHKWKTIITLVEKHLVVQYRGSTIWGAVLPIETNCDRCRSLRIPCERSWCTWCNYNADYGPVAWCTHGAVSDRILSKHLYKDAAAQRKIERWSLKSGNWNTARQKSRACSWTIYQVLGVNCSVTCLNEHLVTNYSWSEVLSWVGRRTSPRNNNRVDRSCRCNSSRCSGYNRC
jgi:hypothetical protein